MQQLKNNTSKIFKIAFLYQACTWFLEIAFVWEVGVSVSVCVCVCVCVRPRAIKIIHVK